MKLSQLRRLIREIVIQEASRVRDKKAKKFRLVKRMPKVLFIPEASQPDWYIEVLYSAELYPTLDKPIYKVARAVGVKESGSGSDGRYRDIGFVTKDEEKAKKFASLVKKIPKVKKVTIQLQDW